MDLNLILLTIASFGGYIFTNRRRPVYKFKTWLDNHIKYSRIFIIPYISLYLYIVYSVFVVNLSIRPLLLTSLIATNTIATVFWYLVPNGVNRDKVPVKNFLDKIANFIYSHDGDTNGFPSGHVFLSLICSYYLFASSSNFLYLIFGIIIAVSTVYTKQHYVIDILGGIIFGSLGILASKYLLFHW